MTPFLGISFTIIICFIDSSYSGRFSPTLGHFISNKLITIEIKNFKYDPGTLEPDAMCLNLLVFLYLAFFTQLKFTFLTLKGHSMH